MTVEDDWQHRGLGKRLAARLGKLAESRGYDRFTATMLPDNRAALGLIRTLSGTELCASRAGNTRRRSRCRLRELTGAPTRPAVARRAVFQPSTNRKPDHTSSTAHFVVDEAMCESDVRTNPAQIGRDVRRALTAPRSTIRHSVLSAPFEASVELGHTAKNNTTSCGARACVLGAHRQVTGRVCVRSHSGAQGGARAWLNAQLSCERRPGIPRHGWQSMLACAVNRRITDSPGARTAALRVAATPAMHSKPPETMEIAGVNALATRPPSTSPTAPPATTKMLNAEMRPPCVGNNELL